MTYPPNGGLTEIEESSLERLKDDPILKSALRKILADNSAGVLFELLNVIDGTSDLDENFGKCTGISFVNKADELFKYGKMLYDELYSKYWD